MTSARFAVSSSNSEHQLALVERIRTSECEFFRGCQAGLYIRKEDAIPRFSSVSLVLGRSDRH